MSSLFSAYRTVGLTCGGVQQHVQTLGDVTFLTTSIGNAFVVWRTDHLTLAMASTTLPSSISCVGARDPPAEPALYIPSYPRTPPSPPLAAMSRPSATSPLQRRTVKSSYGGVGSGRARTNGVWEGPSLRCCLSRMCFCRCTLTGCSACGARWLLLLMAAVAAGTARWDSSSAIASTLALSEGQQCSFTRRRT